MRDILKVLVVLGLFFTVAVLYHKAVTFEPALHQVRYTVMNDSEYHATSLTYENESGGTEQIRVSNDSWDAPWVLEMKKPEGSFVYLSAQKNERDGSLLVMISVDGHVIQKAMSSDQYGIATASGTVH